MKCISRPGLYTALINISSSCVLVVNMRQTSASQTGVGALEPYSALVETKASPLYQRRPSQSILDQVGWCCSCSISTNRIMANEHWRA